MSTTCPCPPVRDLRRLACNPIGERDAGPLQDHLSRCARCLEILEELRSERPADASPPSPAPPAAEGPRDAAGTWRAGLRPSGSAASLPPPAEAPPPPAVPSVPLSRVAADSTQELLTCLAPPQGAGEVGQLGGYRLLHVLGSGATGVVFLAEDSRLSRRVALKVMKPAPGGDDVARQRFLREAQAAAVIEHDNIVTIYQVGEDRNLPFLAMKLLQGETLDDRLKREGQLMVFEVLRIGREIAEGLDAAHEHGLIHRDIKPANLFLEAGTGRVKVVDFGLARTASQEAQLTRTGVIVGTPAYMSPEQARGSRIDHRSDLFSLGCVLYRMCTGRTPFQADDTMGMLVALAQDQPPPIKAFNADAPDELSGLISRLLAKPPEARPQSARAVASALTAIADVVAASRTSERLKPWGGGKAERSWWVTLLQMLALAAVGGSVFWYGPPAYRYVCDHLDDFVTELSHPAGRH